MGMFSWYTQDTNTPIYSIYTPMDSIYAPKPEDFNTTAHMIDDRGNVYTELEYEGYGVFGGMCFYALVSDMNPEHPQYPLVEGADDDGKYARGLAISFMDENYRSPNLVSDPKRPWINEAPDIHPGQGFRRGDHFGSHLQK